MGQISSGDPGQISNGGSNVDGVVTPLPAAGHRVVPQTHGPHVVAAHREGFLDVYRTVTVVDGRATELSLPSLAVDAAGLVARAVTDNATLQVDGPADAVVVVAVDGTAPNRFTLPAGTHRLEVEAKNARPDVRPVRLAYGRTTTVIGDPVLLLRALTIASSPASTSPSTEHPAAPAHRPSRSARSPAARTRRR